MITNVRDLLIAAREKISKEENWTQFTLARNKYDNPVMIGFCDTECKWCATGAIFSVARENLVSPGIQDSAYNCMRIFIADNDIPSFNDNRTHAEVLALFDNAIIYASKRNL